MRTEGSNHIQQKLDEFIRKDLLGGQRREPLQPDEELLKSGIIDSIGFFKLVAFITDQFGAQIPDEELVPENFSSLKVITQRIEEKIAKGHGNR